MLIRGELRYRRYCCCCNIVLQPQQINENVSYSIYGWELNAWLRSSDESSSLRASDPFDRFCFVTSSAFRHFPPFPPLLFASSQAPTSRACQYRAGRACVCSLVVDCTVEYSE
jgi:hypothetical protein